MHIHTCGLSPWLLLSFLPSSLYQTDLLDSKRSGSRPTEQNSSEQGRRQTTCSGKNCWECFVPWNEPLILTCLEVSQANSREESILEDKQLNSHLHASFPLKAAQLCWPAGRRGKASVSHSLGKETASTGNSWWLRSLWLFVNCLVINYI